MQVYIPIGISGSGKSLYQKVNFPKIYTICPDDIRQELLGDASDQSYNDEVWLQAYDRLAKCAIKNKDVYFSSTNLSLKAIDRLKKVVLDNTDNPENVHFVLIEMLDSLDESLCRSRVKSDLENGVIRSNTLKLVNDLEGNQLNYDYVHKQYLDYIKVTNELADYVMTQNEDYNINMTLLKKN